MEKTLTSLLLGAFLCLLSVSNSAAQCAISNSSGIESSQISLGLGQSFTTSCGDGSFQSLTVTNLTNTSDVTLRIYAGEGYTGSPQFTMTGISWTITENLIVIDLDDCTIVGCSTNCPPMGSCTGSLAYTSGQPYTFRFSAGGNFQMLRSTGNPYSGGQRYDNGGTAVSGEDLVFVVQASGSLLPVELTHFDARLEENQIHLTWRTASEKDNAGFEIERSNDGADWVTLDFVPGNGTSTEPHEYAFTDENPLPGDNYYRLRQLDFSGAAEFSDVQHVRLASGKLEDVLVSPNPVQAGQTLTAQLAGASVESVQLIDVLGRIAWESRQLEGDKVGIPLPQDLSKGLCWLVLAGGGERVGKKVLVQ